MTKTRQDELISKVADLQETEALRIVRDCLKEGEDPLVIVDGCQKGMRIVGERYSEGCYFIAGLIMAGEIMRQIMEIITPILEKNPQLEGATGTMLLGTVQEDIHDLGKNIVKMLLTCRGVTVYDLGVNVPPERFSSEALRLKPDIIGLSALITSAYDSLQETISLLRAETVCWPKQPYIIIGGSQVDQQIAKMVGSDYWVTEGDAGVTLCSQLLTDKN